MITQETIKVLKKEICSQVFDYTLKSYDKLPYHKTLDKKLVLFYEKIKNLSSKNGILN